MENRKQIISIGKITTGIGCFYRKATIATQKIDGYWETKYTVKYFVSENIDKLNKLKKGNQYFGEYLGALANER